MTSEHGNGTASHHHLPMVVTVDVFYHGEWTHDAVGARLATLLEPCALQPSPLSPESMPPSSSFDSFGLRCDFLFIHGW